MLNLTVYTYMPHVCSLQNCYSVLQTSLCLALAVACKRSLHFPSICFAHYNLRFIHLDELLHLIFLFLSDLQLLSKQSCIYIMRCIPLKSLNMALCFLPCLPFKSSFPAPPCTEECCLLASFPSSCAADFLMWPRPSC